MEIPYITLQAMVHPPCQLELPRHVGRGGGEIEQMIRRLQHTQPFGIEAESVQVVTGGVERRRWWNVQDL